MKTLLCKEALLVPTTSTFTYSAFWFRTQLTQLFRRTRKLMVKCSRHSWSMMVFCILTCMSPMYFPTDSSSHRGHMLLKHKQLRINIYNQIIWKPECTWSAVPLWLNFKVPTEISTALENGAGKHYLFASRRNNVAIELFNPSIQSIKDFERLCDQVSWIDIAFGQCFETFCP